MERFKSPYNPHFESRNQRQAIPQWQLAAVLLVLALPAISPLAAAGQASMNLSPQPDCILADGKSATTITVTVFDGSGKSVPDGTTVHFITDSGVLDKDTVDTSSGIAHITLTSATSPGTATVRATSFVTGSSSGSATGTTAVVFTSNRDEVYSTGTARWVHVDCPDNVIYSADSKIAEAYGHLDHKTNLHVLAHFQYHALDVTAEKLQVDLQSLLLLAHNATLQRARQIIHAREVRYDLNSSTGTAVVQDASGTHSVSISGYALTTAPLTADMVQDSLQTNQYRFVDISASRVVVTSRRLDANPGDQLQFRRATIYSDGRKVLSVPYHVMPMTTDQLFGQQLLGFGSQGLLVNVPYYYHVSEHSTGTLYLRNSQSGMSGGLSSLSSAFSNQGGGTPGFGLDLVQTYDSGRGGNGNFNLTGLTRGDWGAHWDHTQHFDAATSGYMFIDYPQHQSLYASSNLSRQFNGFSLNVAANASRNPGFLGYSSSSTNVNTYLATMARAVGRTGINVTAGASVQSGQLVTNTPTGHQVTPISDRGLDLRFFTAPLHPDRHSSLTDSLSLGQTWGQGRSAFTMLGNLVLSRAMPHHGNLSMNYSYRYDPLLTQAATATSILDTLNQSSTQHRLFMTYNVAPTSKFDFALTGGYGLPLRDSNLSASANYRLDQNWGFGLTSYLDRYAGFGYHETLFSVSRRILGRDIVFTYSSVTKKVIFDFGASRF